MEEMKTYKVKVRVVEEFDIEVEAESEEMAIENAWDEATGNSDFWEEVDVLECEEID